MRKIYSQRKVYEDFLFCNLSEIERKIGNNYKLKDPFSFEIYLRNEFKNVFIKFMNENLNNPICKRVPTEACCLKYVVTVKDFKSSQFYKQKFIHVHKLETLYGDNIRTKLKQIMGNGKSGIYDPDYNKFSKKTYILWFKSQGLYCWLTSKYLWDIFPIFKQKIYFSIL